MDKEEIIGTLVEIARRAYFLCDDTEEDENGNFTVDPDSWWALSNALDPLDELPDPRPNVIACGPAKAKAILFPGET